MGSYGHNIIGDNKRKKQKFKLWIITNIIAKENLCWER